MDLIKDFYKCPSKDRLWKIKQAQDQIPEKEYYLFLWLVHFKYNMGESVEGPWSLLVERLLNPENQITNDYPILVEKYLESNDEYERAHVLKIMELEWVQQARLVSQYTSVIDEIRRKNNLEENAPLLHVIYWATGSTRAKMLIDGINFKRQAY